MDKNFEDFIVGCQRVVDGYKSKGEADYTELLKYKDLYSPPPEVLTSELEDKTVKAQLTDSDSAKLIQTRRFPGATYVVISAPGTEQKATPVSFIEDTWVKLYTEKSAAEKDSIKVRTFYPNQIVHLATELSKGLDSLGYFDKSWERRDKFQSKLEREVDQIVKEVDQEDHDKVDSTVQRAVRQYAEAFTASVRRRTTFESQFISYALNTASAMLNYSERSLAQHKSK